MQRLIPLIPHIRRVLGATGVQARNFDDCLQHVLLSLCASIKRFDLSRGVPIERYVARRAEWAVRDWQRKQWLLGGSRYRHMLDGMDHEELVRIDSDKAIRRKLAVPPLDSTGLDIRRALDRLPPLERQVEEMRMEGLTHVEIGMELGISTGYSQQLSFFARRRLEKFARR